MQPDQSPRILSLLSHELRGPLGVIRGYLRLLEQTGPELSDSHRQAVTAALKASDRAAELLTQTSMLAQLQRQETPLAFRPIPLRDLLRSAVDGVRPPEEPKVHLELGAVPPTHVNGDGPLLIGAFTTLIAAVVRAEVREATLKVVVEEITRDAGDGVSIRLTTDDWPEGLTESTLDLSRGGLGLDLPIAQQLIAAHHGEIIELRRADRYAGMVVWLPTTS